MVFFQGFAIAPYTHALCSSVAGVRVPCQNSPALTFPAYGSRPVLKRNKLIVPTRFRADCDIDPGAPCTATCRCNFIIGDMRNKHTWWLLGLVTASALVGIHPACAKTARSSTVCAIARAARSQSMSSVYDKVANLHGLAHYTAIACATGL